MDDYPDPDEEYELMYADDLELMREDENHLEANNVRKPLQAKRSLNFSSPVESNCQLKVNHSERPDINTQDVIVGTNQLVTNYANNDDVNNVINTNGPNKRTIEEIFGDIDDMIEFNEELPSKRQKTEEEVDLELINKILDERKMRKLLAEPSKPQGEGIPVYNAKDNLSVDIPRWSFVPITNSEGDRIYVRLQSEESWDQYLEDTNTTSTLHTSYAQVWEEARKIIDKKLEEQSGAAAAAEEGAGAGSGATGGAREGEAGVELWVERYMPHRYQELLSEEAVNRTLLRWLHLWDKVVFKKEVRVLERGGADELEADGRPRLRAALLSGPPGAGKSTLARLLAASAGYRPLELDASAERSQDAFRAALLAATAMRPLLDAQRRPNCLVLDEIDGAPLATVELLVRRCAARVRPLRRPIIAICNDLYAPSLRPLRAVALVVRMGAVSTARLAARLQHVCEREGFAGGGGGGGGNGGGGDGGGRARARGAGRAAGGSGGLARSLAALADGDVRAALATLHFLAVSGQSDAVAQGVGVRDRAGGVLPALRLLLCDRSPSPASALAAVSASGDYDKVACGLFENYLAAAADAAAAARALAHLRLFDAAQAWTQRAQNYSLYALQPASLASCALSLSLSRSRSLAPSAPSAPSAPRFPAQAAEAARRARELAALAAAVRANSASASALGRRALLLDALPLLPHLLAPTLRHHNVQLCSERERRALRAAAAALCDWGLRLQQGRLEPDAARLAFLAPERAPRGLFVASVCAAVAREAQLERLRRLSPAPAARAARAAPAAAAPRAPRAPRAPHVHKDFFGRIVTTPENVHRSDAGHAGPRDLISGSSVFYQYREGFNNAVRRAVRIRDLL